MCTRVDATGDAESPPRAGRSDPAYRPDLAQTPNNLGHSLPRHAATEGGGRRFSVLRDAAELLGLTRMAARAIGQDALRGKERIQIKGRAYGRDAKSGQQLSRFKIDAPCDTALLVILDNATLERDMGGSVQIGSAALKSSRLEITG